MRLLLKYATLLLSIAAVAHADDKWTKFRSGPFEVFTNGGEKNARERLTEAEEFRYTLGKLIGKDNPQSIFPIRIIVLKNASQASSYRPPNSLAMGRDAWMSAPNPEAPFDREWKKVCARILMDENTTRIPDEIEAGLITLLSTLQSKGPKVTLGTPPPPAERDKAWARLELLATTADYADRMHIFISNLQNGADYDSVYRNAFEVRAADFDKKVDAFLAAGNFQSVPFSGAALSDRDYTAREATAGDGKLALADLLLTNPARAGDAAEAYKAAGGPAAQEGLGFIAQRAGNAEAVKDFEAATQAGSQNARAWVGLNTRAGFQKAALLNPRWAEPHIRLAALEQDPARKAVELQKAATLDPRNTALWQQLAIAYTDASQFIQAGKAWSGAERAAGSPEERQKMRQARLDNEAQRSAFIEAERKRKEEESARDLQRIKDAALADIRAAEAKANKQMAAGGPVPKNPQPWVDTPAGSSQKVTGTLQKIECLPHGRARLVMVTEEQKTVQVMVSNTSTLNIGGTGELSLACGAQKPARALTVEYKPDKNPKSTVLGEAQFIEFR